MTIKIESIINQWDSETNDVIVRFLNLLTSYGDGEADTFG